jgi:hypothetical protein
MDDELTLLKEYAETFGPHEVYYDGPKLPENQASVWLQESSDAGKTVTKRRRRQMHNKVKSFRLIQVTRALAMQQSRGYIPPRLLFATDTLLKR